MTLEQTKAALAPVLERVRAEEPGARAFFLFGSHARGEAGAFSDVDVRLVTDGAPAQRVRMCIGDVAHDGAPVPTHVSIGAHALADMEAAARAPSGWAWSAGFVDGAVTLEDADGVRERIRAALVKPARLESDSGLHSDLEDLVEHLAKARNALAKREHERVFRHAGLVAQNARRALVPFGPVVPARRGDEPEERALATMSRAFLADMALIAGETPWARDAGDVVRSCAKVARDVVVKLEGLVDPPLHDPLRGDLASGRVRALVERLR